MRILFVCNNYGPFSTNCGANQRSYFIKKALEKLGRVDVLQFTDERINLNNATICSKIKFSNWDNIRNIIYKHFPFTMFYLNIRNSQCESIFKLLYNTERYDVVVFRYLQTFFMCGAPNIPNKYLDMDDVPWELIKQYAEKQNFSFARRFQFWIKYSMNYYQGKRLNKKFETIFYSNEKDAIKYGGTYLPNIPYVTFSKNNIGVLPKTLLFVGWLAHMPNVLGLDHFLEFIWPKVSKLYPDTIFNIVGKQLPKAFHDKWEKIKNVNLLGFVDSLINIYEQSAVVICPIYQGSGSNIKVLEALAYNRPCIISEFALRGFEHILLDKEDLLVCKNDDDFISNISFAFENSEKMKQMAHNGYMKVKDNFSDETVFKILNNTIYRK